MTEQELKELLKEITKKTKELSMQLNYACYDEDYLKKSEKVWKKLHELEDLLGIDE